MLNTDHRLRMVELMWIAVMFFNKTGSTQTSISQPNPVTTANVGDNVTVHCFRLGKDNTEAIIWYKVNIGHEPRIIATVYLQPIYKDEFKPPKFSIQREKMSCHLKIANVEPSDEAMYYCASLDYEKKIGNGTFLSVKGRPDLSVSVIQSGVSDSVSAGASVTLQCSAVLSESRAAELQVLWFRAAPPQSHPQIIYTHHNSSHQCESSSSTHTCVYNFSKNILSVNDTGTYYCAVAVCGKIIFGNGTPVQIVERSVEPVVICLTVALGVCVVVIFTLIFLITWKWKHSEQCGVRLIQGSVTDKTLNQDGENMELNYAALHFNNRRAKRGRGKKQQPQDMIYSDVQSQTIS